VRFVTDVIQGRLVVSNKRKTELLAELAQRRYAPMPRSARKAAPKVAGNLDDEDSHGDSGADGAAGASAGAGAGEASDYDYLLSMPLWSLTWEKVRPWARMVGRQGPGAVALSAGWGWG
jgi:DNA topoisomerase II